MLVEKVTNIYYNHIHFFMQYWIDNLRSIIIIYMKSIQIIRTSFIFAKFYPCKYADVHLIPLKTN